MVPGSGSEIVKPVHHVTAAGVLQGDGVLGVEELFIVDVGDLGLEMIVDIDRHGFTGSTPGESSVIESSDMAGRRGG